MVREVGLVAPPLASQAHRDPRQLRRWKRSEHVPQRQALEDTERTHRNTKVQRQLRPLTIPSGGMRA